MHIAFHLLLKIAPRQGAMERGPNSDEARAAKYNAACCYTKLKRWTEAAEAVQSAVNDYDLKLIVAMKDGDLAPLRERKEFQEVLYNMTGYVTEKQMVQLRTESKAPFRLTRLFLFGGFLALSGLGLIFIGARLVLALKGGEGAPDLNETLQNLGVNVGVAAVCAALLNW